MDYCVWKGFVPTKDFFDSGPIPKAAPEYFALYIAHEFGSHRSLHHLRSELIHYFAGAMRLTSSLKFNRHPPKRPTPLEAAISMPPRSVLPSATSLDGHGSSAANNGLLMKTGPRAGILRLHHHWQPICCLCSTKRYLNHCTKVSQNQFT